MKAFFFVIFGTLLFTYGCDFAVGLFSSKCPELIAMPTQKKFIVVGAVDACEIKSSIKRFFK